MGNTAAVVRAFQDSPHCIESLITGRVWRRVARAVTEKKRAADTGQNTLLIA